MLKLELYKHCFCLIYCIAMYVCIFKHTHFPIIPCVKTHPFHVFDKES